MSFHIKLLISSKFSALQEHSLSFHRKTHFFLPALAFTYSAFWVAHRSYRLTRFFCSLINSLTHAFFSFHFGCCLTDSPDSKAKALPLVCSELAVFVTAHQGKSARGSCFALNTTSLFSISNKRQKWNSTVILPSAPSFHFHRCLHPHFPSQQGTCSSSLQPPQWHGWRTCLCSPCCHFQPLLLLLFITPLSWGAFSLTFCSAIPRFFPISLLRISERGGAVSVSFLPYAAGALVATLTSLTVPWTCSGILRVLPICFSFLPIDIAFIEYFLSILLFYSWNILLQARTISLTWWRNLSTWKFRYLWWC